MPFEDIRTQFPWQKVNPTATFKKSRGYFNIWPIIGTFTIPQITQGTNQIFEQYNYSATRNFSITNVTVDKKFQPFIDYDLIIRHNNSDGTINRYKLWPFDVPGTETLNIEKYAGQIIKKNFSIELWALNIYGQENILDVLKEAAWDAGYPFGSIYENTLPNVGDNNVDLVAGGIVKLGDWYYYSETDNTGKFLTIDDNVITSGTVFQANASALLEAYEGAKCTASIRHIPDYSINSAAAAAAGVTQQTVAQTKVNISLLKDKALITDPDEFEEVSVSSVPCNVQQAGVFNPSLFVFPIPFLACSAGLPNN